MEFATCLTLGTFKLNTVIYAIINARSPKISQIAQKLPSSKSFEASYKSIQRLLSKINPEEMLSAFFNQNSEFVIVDPTEIEKKYSKNTSYVGKLSDGKTNGFNCIVFSVPFGSRTIIFATHIYSSSTINQDLSSRNIKHMQAVEKILPLIKDKVLIMDREFSYLEFFDYLQENGIRFIIRLNIGVKPTITDKRGNKVNIDVGRGEKKVYKDVYYKGKIRGNIVCIWDKRFAKPLVIFTNIEDREEVVEIYKKRMKIEESFRDLKSIFNMEGVMNKKMENTKKMIDLLMVAYNILLMIGQQIKGRYYYYESRGIYSGLYILVSDRFEVRRDMIEFGVIGVINYLRGSPDVHILSELLS